MPSIIKTNIPLGTRTTLRVGGSAEFFAQVETKEELESVIDWAKEERVSITILGSGSNVLVPDSGVKGLVIQPIFLDVVYTERDNETLVTAGAGVTLDTLILNLVEKELWGLENLSSIPGTVGAVPIQNVGAYGVEAKDVVHEVTVYDLDACSTKTFSNEMCNFSYRDSIFKQSRGRYIIVDVTFKLSHIPNRVLAYSDLQKHFATNQSPTIAEIRNAIISIRSKKFPNWNEVGTAGSFFKNPSVSKDVYGALRESFPELPGHENTEGMIKLSLGWILDRVCGLRGFTLGNVGLYTEQALVLVCNKNATATEIANFSEKIIDIVYKKIGVVIEHEVTFLK